MSTSCQSARYLFNSFFPAPLQGIYYFPCFGVRKLRLKEANALAWVCTTSKQLSRNSDPRSVNPKLICFLSNFCHMDSLRDLANMRVRETTLLLLSCQWSEFSSAQWHSVVGASVFMCVLCFCRSFSCLEHGICGVGCSHLGSPEPIPHGHHRLHLLPSICLCREWARGLLYP